MYVPFNGSSVLDSLIRQNIRRLPEVVMHFILQLFDPDP
jgi:hypothetical protein